MQSNLLPCENLNRYEIKTKNEIEKWKKKNSIKQTTKIYKHQTKINLHADKNKLTLGWLFKLCLKKKVLNCYFALLCKKIHLVCYYIYIRLYNLKYANLNDRY